jgi:enamine deaminase RidA (YjgF/YER057c/UK114 family)
MSTHPDPTSQRANFSSGAPWEAIVGYSRAVRVGNQVFVTGTVAARDGQVVGPGDMYLQTQTALEIILKYLAQAGAAPEHVVRTRIYVTDISRWEEAGRAHGEVFGAIRPCTTLVAVQALISPEYLVEIEADAIIN